MVDANWPRQGEPDFSGWLDQLDDEEGTFEQRWLRLSEGCLRIFRRAPVGVLPPACGPARPGCGGGRGCWRGLVRPLSRAWRGGAEPGP